MQVKETNLSKNPEGFDETTKNDTYIKFLSSKIPKNGN